MTATELIAKLGLQPHPTEGGYFVETYRSAEQLSAHGLPARYGGSRVCGTAIYYLITPDSFSALHRLTTDEVFHFYLGEPVEMLQLHPNGTGQWITLGTDLAAGMRPQIVVPRGVWQGTRLIDQGQWALLGTTMAPGFDVADYEPGQRAALIGGYPQFREAIIALTKV